MNRFATEPQPRLGSGFRQNISEGVIREWEGGNRRLLKSTVLRAIVHFTYLTKYRLRVSHETKFLLIFRETCGGPKSLRLAIVWANDIVQPISQ